MQKLARAIPILMLASLAACTSGAGLTEDSKLAVKRLTDLPPPTREDLSVDERPYLIGPFDKIDVTVFGVEELSAEVQADASGRISLPLVGEVDAAGKTSTELARAIEAKLRANYVRDPRVTVNLKETVSQLVTVDGSVREPGLYPVIGRMTLMRAIATAKGTSEFAMTSKVVVFRTVEGQKLAALYSLKDIRQGAYADPEIFAKDVIVVSDSIARRLFRDAITTLPALVVITQALSN